MCTYVFVSVWFEMSHTMPVLRVASGLVVPYTVVMHINT